MKNFIITTERLEEIKPLLPTIIYNELLKHTDKPVDEPSIISGVEAIPAEPVIEENVQEEVVVTKEPSKQDYIDAISGIEATLDLLEGEQKDEAIAVIESYKMIISDMSDTYDKGGDVNNRFYIKPNFGHWSVVDSNTDEMIVGYKLKDDAKQTAEGLNKIKDSEKLNEAIKHIKTVEGYSRFLKLSKGGSIKNKKVEVDYTKWEENTADEIVKILDVDYSDAQGIIEANQPTMSECWNKKLSPKATAHKLINKSK